MPEIILEKYEDEEGFGSLRHIEEAKVVRFHEALTTRGGSRVSLALQAAREGYRIPIAEAVDTSDFPTLLGVIIDREMLAAYKANIPDWKSYVKVGRVPNFNTHDLFKISGQDTILPQVAEGGPYLETPSTPGTYHRRVYKWGRKFSISFEALINDALGAFDDITDRFSTAALRTEARNATLTFCTAAGPAVTLFGATVADCDGQAVTNVGVLPLTIANLQTTIVLMSQQVDVNGAPISVEAVHLVVPPALELTARQILTSSWVAQVDTAGAANAVPSTFVPLPTANVLPQMGLQLHVNRELASIDTSGNCNGTWYLFADPSQGAAVQMDYLRGHEIPEVRMKAVGGTAVGGGAIDPMEGDFSNDSIAYRVRCIHGGTHLDPHFCYAQVHA